MEMGYREYARHRGVTLGAVQKAIRANRIAVNANGKIDPVAADAAWDANTDASRVAVNILASAPEASPAVPEQRSAAAPLPQGTIGELPFDGEDSEGEDLTGTDKTANEYREHRSMRERFQALKQKIEYEQLAGSVIGVEEAKRIAYTSFRTLRDAVMNVSPRIKDQLAALTDPHEVEQLLEMELSEALGAIDLAKLLNDQDE